MRDIEGLGQVARLHVQVASVVENVAQRQRAARFPGIDTIENPSPGDEVHRAANMAQESLAAAERELVAARDHEVIGVVSGRSVVEQLGIARVELEGVQLLRVLIVHRCLQPVRKPLL